MFSRERHWQYAEGDEATFRKETLKDEDLCARSDFAELMQEAKSKAMT